MKRKTKAQTYIVTTKSGHEFRVQAYSNFHAGVKAQSIGGSGCSIRKADDD